MTCALDGRQIGQCLVLKITVAYRDLTARDRETNEDGNDKVLNVLAFRVTSQIFSQQTIRFELAQVYGEPLSVPLTAPGSENENVTPGPSFGVADNRPR